MNGYNGVRPSLMVLREDEVQSVHHHRHASVAARRRSRHHLAAALLVLVFFVASAVHLVGRMRGKDRHVRHGGNVEQNTSVSSSSVTSVGVHHQPAAQVASSDSLFDDEGETKIVSSSKENNDKNIPSVTLDVDQTAISNVAGAERASPPVMNTTSNGSSTHLGGHNNTISGVNSGVTNTSIPLDGKEHKAS